MEKLENKEVKITVTVKLVLLNWIGILVPKSTTLRVPLSPRLFRSQTRKGTG